MDGSGRDDLASLEDTDPAVDSDGGDSDWEEWADDGEVQDEAVGDVEKMVEDVDISGAKTVDNFWERPRTVKKVLIIYHSLFGNLGMMAEEIKRGVESEPDCEAFIFQVPEIYPQSFLEKVNASRQFASKHPTLTRTDIKHFPLADGFVFGMSSRFGSIPAPMKSFFDSTGALWLKGALIGKPAALFSSAATQGGGSEVMAMGVVTLLAHHGMLFVPPAFSLQDTGATVGAGSPYGANCVTGLDGVRAPSQIERSHAMKQGTHFAAVVSKIA